MKRIAMLFPGCIAREDSPMQIPSHVQLVKNLSKDFDIVVFSVIKPDDDYIPFKCGNASVIFINALYNDAFYKRIWAYYIAFRNEHRRKPFNIVHGFWAYYCGVIAVMLGKLFHVTSFVTLQGGETAKLPNIRYGNRNHFLLKFITAFTCKSADVLITLTKFQQDALPMLGVLRRDIQIIPFGAQKMFYHISKRKDFSKPVHFLHVAGINHVKDQTTLLKTFQLIRQSLDCRLRIVGEDHLHGKIHRLAAELHIQDHIEFTGFIPHNALATQYDWGDILLLTSLHEGQGVVIAEAAAAGLLLCGTNVGLLSDLSPHAAITVPPGDYVGLAGKILELVHDTRKQNELRINAMEWAKSHESDWTVNQYSTLYGNVDSER